MRARRSEIARKKARASAVAMRLSLRRTALTALAALALPLLSVSRADSVPRLHEFYPSAFNADECAAIAELFSASSPEVDSRRVGTHRTLLLAHARARRC